MSEDNAPTSIELPATLDAGMDMLRKHYDDQYDVRMVPSVILGGAPGSHRCRCTIYVKHGAFSASAVGSYLEALQDALKQTLEAPQ